MGSTGRQVKRLAARLRAESGPARVRRRLRGASVITILYRIVEELLSLYRWVVILAVVFSLLSSFGVLDTRNRLVWTIGDFLYRLTEPLLRPIRNIIPAFGSLDISPVILLVLIWAVQMVLTRVYAAVAFGDMRGLVY